MLSARRLLDHQDLDGAANRAYYSMFHAARAGLSSKGIDTSSKKHGTVVGMFGQHFVKDGPLPKELGRMLNEALQLRTGADYDVMWLEHEEVVRVVSNAERFVRTIELHLSAASASGPTGATS